ASNFTLHRLHVRDVKPPAEEPELHTHAVMRNAGDPTAGIPTLFEEMAGAADSDAVVEVVAVLTRHEIASLQVHCRDIPGRSTAGHSRLHVRVPSIRHRALDPEVQ